MGSGQHRLGGGAPVGGEPAVNRFNVAEGAVQRTDQSFGGIGSQPGFGGTIPLGVPPQQQMLFDAKCCTHVRQPAIADQLGPQVGAGTHREIGVVAINEFGGGEPQHRITKELQPFQVAGPAARHVGEGLIHQGE